MLFSYFNKLFFSDLLIFVIFFISCNLFLILLCSFLSIYGDTWKSCNLISLILLCISLTLLIIYYLLLITGLERNKANIIELFDMLLLIFLSFAIWRKVFIASAFNSLIFTKSLPVILLLINFDNFNFFNSLFMLFCFLFCKYAFISRFNAFLTMPL